MKASIFIARFPYGNSEVPDVGDYLVDTVLRLKKSPHISDIFHERYDDTPITMTRNAAVRDAQSVGADLLLMIDSDMDCDAYVRHAEIRDPNAKPFLEVAIPFLMEHAGPAVIGVPYCGPPPHENVYVFRPGKKQSDHPNADCRVEQFTREEAAQRAGIEEVFALPTGLILFDMRAFKDIKRPYFRYEWDSDEESKKGSTEDVYTTRNCALVGIKQYVAWDCWGRHWKRKPVGKPALLTMDMVREDYREAVKRGQLSTEKLVMIGEGKQRPPAAQPLMSTTMAATYQQPLSIDNTNSPSVLSINETNHASPSVRCPSEPACGDCASGRACPPDKGDPRQPVPAVPRRGFWSRWF
jgi:hypothetical protein